MLAAESAASEEMAQPVQTVPDMACPGDDQVAIPGQAVPQDAIPVQTVPEVAVPPVPAVPEVAIPPVPAVPEVDPSTAVVASSAALAETLPVSP